jgi:DNA-binding CsgD family transcriptional regulator
MRRPTCRNATTNLRTHVAAAIIGCWGRRSKLIEARYPLITHDDYLRIVRLTAGLAVAEDPAERQQLLMIGAQELVRASMAMITAGEAGEADLTFDLSTFRTIGWRDDACFQQIVQSSRYKQNPVIEPGMRRLVGRPWMAADREEFFDDCQWQRIPFVQSVIRALDIGPSIYAASRLQVPNRGMFLSLHRPWNDRCRFESRDLERVNLLLELVHRMASLFCCKGPEPHLSPRLRQTLQGLLAGWSEKEIAHDLGLSSSTVHHYVTEIYSLFRVHSARELMVLLLGPKQ